MRKKANIRKRIIDPERLGFLPELKGIMCCTVVEDKSIIIENGGNIAVFTDKVILLEKEEKQLWIRGKDLSICEMGDTHIAVTGIFKSIEYKKGEEDALS